MSKRTIRRGVFETNSSSVHTITICTSEDYEKWESGETILQCYPQKLIAMEEVKELYKNDEYRDKTQTFEKWLEDQYEDGEFKTHEVYCGDYDYEKYRKKFTTPSGEEVIAFGYYGSDC